MKTKSAIPKNKKQFATVWSELADVCKKIHRYLYTRNDKASASRFESQLQRVLDDLPKNDLAILREEGLALLHELRDEIAAAIKHRKKEIKLTQRLHDSVRKSVEAGHIDATMAASILEHRDESVLKKRIAILSALEDKANRASQIQPRNGRLALHK
jgi:hypothetical protein